MFSVPCRTGSAASGVRAPMSRTEWMSEYSHENDQLNGRVQLPCSTALVASVMISVVFITLMHHQYGLCRGRRVVSSPPIMGFVGNTIASTTVAPMDYFITTELFAMLEVSYNSSYHNSFL